MAPEAFKPRPGLVRLVEEQITFPTHEDIAVSVEQILARYHLFVNGVPGSPLYPYGVDPRYPDGRVEWSDLAQEVRYADYARLALIHAGVMSVGEIWGNGEGEPILVTLDREALDRYLTDERSVEQHDASSQ